MTTSFSLGPALLEAQKSARAGNLDQAATLYRQILERFPKNKAARDGLQSLQKKRGAQGKVRGKTGGKVVDLKKLSAALFRRGEYEALLKQEAALKKAMPGDPDLLNILGAAHAATGDYPSALACYDQAITSDPGYARAHGNKGNALQKSDRPQDAIAAYHRALELQPSLIGTLGGLHDAYEYLGQREVAEEYYKGFTERHPDLADGFLFLGMVQYALKKLAEAQAAYERMTALAPDQAKGFHNLGTIHKALHAPEKALACFERAAELDPTFADTQINMGNLLWRALRHEEAIASYERALELGGDARGTYNNLGIVYRDLGDEPKAQAYFEKSLEIDPMFADANYNLALGRKLSPDDPLVTRLQTLATDPDVDIKSRIRVNFSLGDAFSGMKETEKSFEYYAAGNALRANEEPYSPRLDEALLGELQFLFRKQRVARLSIPEDTEPAASRPIFILGMPRSGTTLTEQILASHSEVFGAGELGHLQDSLAVFKDKITGLAPVGLTKEELLQLRQDYLQRLDFRNVSKPVFTDKMPLNFRFIGFILAAFPEARIVHLNRDPMAVGWSLFKHNFVSVGNAYAHRQEDIAFYYHLHNATMAFWHEMFPGQVYELDYEGLTEDQESESRKLLEHCGLEWEDQVLAFHKTKRVVQTASRLQVRKPLYKGSSAAWKRYESHLEPMQRGLDTPVEFAEMHELSDAEILRRSATALYYKGDFQGVLDQQDALLAALPEDPRVFNLLGVSHAALMQYDQAIAWYEKALEIEPESAETYHNIGNARRKTNRHEEAVMAYRKALELNPDFLDTLKMTGRALIGLKRFDEAVADLQDYVKRMPEDASGFFWLGTACQQNEKPELAIKAYEAALLLKPDYADVLFNLGMIYKRQNQYEKALACFEKDAILEPGEAEVHFNVGALLRPLNRQPEAVVSLMRAIAIKPDYAFAHNMLGMVQNDLGRRDLAQECFEKAIEIRPGYLEPYGNLAVIKKFSADDPLIPVIEKLAAQPGLSPKEKVWLSFTLGTIFESCGDIDTAFRYYAEGNATRSGNTKYNPVSETTRFEDIKLAFRENRVPMLQSPDAAEPLPWRPIFITGMPRSGTTLVEQILSSHSLVHAAGELDDFKRAVDPILNKIVTRDPTGLSQDEVLSIRKSYASQVGRRGITLPVFTDKMPLNFRLIGLILAAFPEAKVINLKRDPMAVGWSIFKRNFSSEGNKYAHDQGHIAHFIHLHDDLMRFWHETFPGRIHQVDYETLTENQEAESRALLAYCDLAWEDQVLSFQKTKRAVRTASSQQVRQKMYKGSSQAWKAFEPYLEPMKQALNYDDKG